MQSVKLGLLGASLAALLTFTACGGGGDATDVAIIDTPEVGTINITDPAEPVQTDVAIGGSFEGDQSTPPPVTPVTIPPI